MQLTPQQIIEFLEIIRYNQSLFVVEQLGKDFLEQHDIDLLLNYGVDLDSLYNEDNDSLYSSFHLGMLAVALHDNNSLNQLSLNQLQEYIKNGRYIPITETEKQIINSLKIQTLLDIKSLNGRIFQDINTTLSNQEDLLKETMIQGQIKRQSIKQISNILHEKTKDWNRDFDRIVEYQMNSAFQAGRLTFIEKNNPQQLVYKQVMESGCKECLRLYTKTATYLSEPILFTIDELRKNGTNIGRKTKDWKATVDSTHPFCRCILRSHRRGYNWDIKKQDYSLKQDRSENNTDKKIRKPIRITIGSKELVV